jgi:uncharacterized membrane protein YkvA (DUF1232 family)
MSLPDEIKRRIQRLKIETYALYLAYRDPRTPWYAKAFACLVVAYALSPIDLIPDFIPVLGYLDDLLLLPIGIYFALKLIPGEVMDECRARAATVALDRSRESRLATIVILAIWAIGLAIFIFICYKFVWPYLTIYL